jgi:hypothetical protein
MTWLWLDPGEGLSRYSRGRNAQDRRWWWPRTAAGRRCRSRYPPSPRSAPSSASTSAVPGLASDVGRAARLTTGPYTSPDLVSTRPVAMPTRNAGRPLPAPVRAGEPERDRGRVAQPVCDEQHLVADHLDHPTVVAHHGLGGVLLEGSSRAATSSMSECLATLGYPTMSANPTVRAAGTS